MTRFTVVNRKIADLPPLLRGWFLDGPEPVQVQLMNQKLVARYWRKHGAAMVEEFAHKEPGRRPEVWWQWNAPEPRVRLGGVGIEAHKRLAYSAHCTYGIVDVFIHCDDPSNLPFFESEAAYLRRLGLFLPGEEQRLPPTAYDEEEIGPERILKWRPLAELEAEYAARKLAGTLGKHDPRFDK